MASHNYQKLRLVEFNSFDIERLLKENVDTLEEENNSILEFIESSGDELPSDVIVEFSETVEDNTAEEIYILSLTHHAENIYNYFAGGPLFRKDRDAR